MGCDVMCDLLISEGEVPVCGHTEFRGHGQLHANGRALSSPDPPSFALAFWELLTERSILARVPPRHCRRRV